MLLGKAKDRQPHNMYFNLFAFLIVPNISLYSVAK